MKSRGLKTALTLCIVTTGIGGMALGDTTLTSRRIATGLSRPCFVTHAPNDYSRIFVVEQRSGTDGRIRIINIPANTLVATPFLTIGPVSSGSEQGLLGLAFHPNYEQNGYFYVNFTDASGNTVIRRYTVSADPNIADAGSGLNIMTLAQPFSNHNGGWIGFGPDGYLYDAQGDGGSGNDPGNRAQTITGQLLGKILRIDVDGDDFPGDATKNYAIPPANPYVGIAGDDEIWHLGVRNPWRNSFDRETGDLYLGDVGQDAREEVDFQAANDPTKLPGQAGYQGGKNFGWRCREGDVCTPPGNLCTPCTNPNFVEPIHVYNNSGSFVAVTGGYVYRGCAIPDLQGTYFFADYGAAVIWSFRWNGVVKTDFEDRTVELTPNLGVYANLASFGEDAFGEIYICRLASADFANNSGVVYKIEPAALVGPDCNGNSKRDECDILSGASRDCNSDGVPDECQAINYACDTNCDGSVNLFDIDSFVDLLSAGSGGCTPCAGDANSDGSINLFDIDGFVDCLTGP